MIELISGLLGVFIGSISSYYLSTRLLRKQSEIQFANEYISKNYLPFLSTIEEFLFGVYMWRQASKKDIDKNSDSPLTEIEASQICAKIILEFKQELKQFIESGVFLIIKMVNEKLALEILGAHYYMKRLNFQPENITDVSEININLDVIIELGEKISDIPITSLVKEYQNIMKNNLKLKRHLI